MYFLDWFVLKREVFDKERKLSLKDEAFKSRMIRRFLKQNYGYFLEVDLQKDEFGWPYFTESSSIWK